MCIKSPSIAAPAPAIVGRDDAGVQNARQRRLALSQNTGGRLATRKFGGGNSDRRLVLG